MNIVWIISCLKSEIVRFWDFIIAIYSILSLFKAGILITSYIV